jgi:hypothetical protein
MADMTVLSKTLKAPAHKALVVACRIFGRDRTFDFEGTSLHYNNTASTERCIEIPIALHFTRPGQHVLEVGNVLNHYVPFPHDVVDKYEVADGVLNCDVVDYRTEKKYDLVIAISTIEHVGWDEPLKDPTKPLTAIEDLRSMLSPDGQMVITVPHGYNPYLDSALAADRILCRKHYRYRRESWLAWSCVPNIDPSTRYGHPYPCANAIHVLVI